MQLKSKIVEVEGYGEVEIREPLYDDIEEMFFTGAEGPSAKPTELLRKCLYKPGTDQRIFDERIGASLGLKLMRLSPDIMAFLGMTTETTEEKKDSAQDS